MGEVNQTRSALDDEIRPALKVILQSEPNMVKKAWKKYLDKYYQVDMKNDGLFGWAKTQSAENVYFREIADNPISLTTSIVPTYTGSEMNLFITFAEDSFLNQYEHPEAFANARHIVNDFVDEFRTNKYRKKANMVEERIAELEVNSDELLADRIEIRDELKENITRMESLRSENRELRDEIAKLQDQYNEIEMQLNRQRELLRQFEKLSNEMATK